MDKPSLSATGASPLPSPATEERNVPGYLRRAYWWAYLHPSAVRFFERQWLVNLILWGNFGRLRDEALAELGQEVEGRTLQVACVYGDFTPRLADRLAPSATLDLVDVADVQLENARGKLNGRPRVRLHRQDAARLQFEDGVFDNTVLFFLLHEQPEDVRRATLKEALRVTRSDGRVVLVDYHRPPAWNPMRYVMTGVFRLLEPFAEGFWQRDIAGWSRLYGLDAVARKSVYFGGLYQKTVIRRRP